jgi:hypothetical protein
MAHYRRKRSAVHTRSRYSHRSSPTYWLSSWPAWWDIVFHRRPERRRARELVNAVLRGHVDPDAVAWPVPKKPHIYYW